MKKSLFLTAAAVASFTFSNLCFAQNAKIRNNKEILMEISLNSNSKTLLKWVSPEGHHPSRFIVQRSKNNETYFDIREIDVARSEERRVGKEC